MKNSIAMIGLMACASCLHASSGITVYIPENLKVENKPLNNEKYSASSHTGMPVENEMMRRAISSNETNNVTTNPAAFGAINQASNSSDMFAQKSSRTIDMNTPFERGLQLREEQNAQPIAGGLSHVAVDPAKITTLHEANPDFIQEVAQGKATFYDPSKMTAPLQKYIETLKSSKIYSNIPNDILTAYVIDCIETNKPTSLLAVKFGYTPVAPQDLVNKFNFAWNDPNFNGSSQLGNLYKSLTILNHVYEPSYKIETQNLFMTESMQGYVDALRSKYQSVPDRVLQAYVTEFFKDPLYKKFEKKEVTLMRMGDAVSASVNAPVQYSPKELMTEDVGFNVDNPSRVQQLYAALQAIEAINAKYPADYKTQGGASEPKPLTLEKAITTPGNANRLLLMSGIDKTSLNSPTDAQLSVASIKQKLRENNPSYDALVKQQAIIVDLQRKIVESPTVDLQNQLQQAQAIKNNLLNSLSIDFVTCNQDIIALQAKIDAMKNPLDELLQQKYQIVFQQSQAFAQQMNNLIIKFKVEDYISGLLTSKDFSITQAVEKSWADLQDTATQQQLLDTHNQVAILMGQQQFAIYTRIETLLESIKSELSKFNDDKKQDLVTAQQRLKIAERSMMSSPFEQKYADAVMTWTGVIRQLNIDIAVEQNNAAIKQAEVAKLTPIVENASDPVNLILQNLTMSFKGKNEAISTRIQELKNKYNLDSKKDLAEAVKDFEQGLKELSNKNPDVDLYAYSKIMTDLQVNILEKIELDAELKSKNEQLKMKNERLNVAIDHCITDILANDLAVHANIDKIKAMLVNLKQRSLDASLSSSDKSGLEGLLKSENTTNVDAASGITTVADLIALYEKVLPKLEAKKIDKTEGTTLYQSINAVASGVDYVMNSFVGSKDSGAVQQEKVETALHVFVEKVCTLQGLAYGSVSAVGLTTIRYVIRDIARLLISIQNDNNLTAQEKNKKQHELLQSGVMDIAYIIAADKTGADINVLASGNVQSIATSAGLNKAINMLNPNDPYSYNASADPGIYMNNINNFKAQYAGQQNMQQSYNNPSSGFAYANSYALSPSSYSSSTYPSYEELAAMAS